MEKFTLCIDLDDTLIPNAYLYQVANWKCGAILSDAIAPFSMSAVDILRREDVIDIENSKRFGFSQRRFPYSWVQLYREIARELQLPVVPSVRRALYHAACGFREGPFEVFPHVHETLGYLRAEGHRLVLITAGDCKLQKKKIMCSGVLRYFHDVHIVGMDKRPILQDELRLSLERVVMVGDSKKSDIAPAIEVGVIPVWLARGVQWSFAQQDVDHDKYHTINHFRELPALLSRIAGNP